MLGALIGIERGHKGKPAGMRTYALISLGASLFTVIAGEALQFVGAISTAYDPGRVFGNIIVGIGFVAAGVIMRREDKVEGLTTAAGIWIAAGIGMSVGAELYAIGLITTLIVIFIFWPLGHLERYIEDKFGFEMTRSYKARKNGE